MHPLQDVLLPLLVWLGFVVVIGFFALMYRWARAQKGAAMAFGMFVQMFLPDPNVQKTIAIVVEAKAEDKQKKPSAQTSADDHDVT
ncbi:hypothetical protein LJ739_17240 [Aestuariibacter halophilus]|uniref:Uncharacterized protein n=1 Tax=Fluctibacter halophilus TaxID=226011 RepID=A0ABS8GBP9_9ALTE|nr:hypothetical protein [Aestuariibacter halophilus]MCC2618002.1 hypothetical protein [Aestuariibacter halophilus]